MIAPLIEVCKHASAHHHVQLYPKYHYNVASSLFAYISYKVFELLITSFIKCNTLKICKHRFKICKFAKIKHLSTIMNILNNPQFAKNISCLQTPPPKFANH